MPIGTGCGPPVVRPGPPVPACGEASSHPCDKPAPDADAGTVCPRQALDMQPGGCLSFRQPIGCLSRDRTPPVARTEGTRHGRHPAPTRHLRPPPASTSPSAAGDDGWRGGDVKSGRRPGGGRGVPGAGRPQPPRLLDSLNAGNGQTLRELCAGLDMARQSVSKHLAVLEAANLVTTVRRGREKLHYLNAEPINAHRRPLDRPATTAAGSTRSPTSRPHWRSTTMTQPRLRLHDLHPTTPEQLWQALTDPAFTERYWDVTFDTDWQVGSPMTWDTTAWSWPTRRRSCSRPTRTGAWPTPGTPSRRSSPSPSAWTTSCCATLAAERRSKVTFELEPVGDAGQAHRRARRLRRRQHRIRDGQRGLAARPVGLKTLLETRAAPDPVCGELMSVRQRSPGGARSRVGRSGPAKRTFCRTPP